MGTVHDERCGIGSSPPNQFRIVDVADLAQRQWGRVSWEQLRRAGVSKARLSSWLADGYLHWIHPGVYAVGHDAPSLEGELAAALLYAGPGAVLSHTSAAWWWQLTKQRPSVIEVSTPRCPRSRPGLLAYTRRSVERVWHRGLPVTTVAQTLLDFAARAPGAAVRRALAEADYHRLLDYRAALNVLGHGKPGSAKLRRAVGAYRPELAATRSVLEERFLALCEQACLPRPQVNVTVCGLTVDVFWPRQRLVVELDGQRGHGTTAQVARDHARDLRLRAAGFTVRRYGWDQVTRQPELVLVDLGAALGSKVSLRAAR